MSQEKQDRLERFLEISLANRQLEIELVWKRTVVFWGFVAALFVGVAAVLEKQPRLATVLSLAGVVFSVTWTLVNRGSRLWQENWELKVDHLVQELYGTLPNGRPLFKRQENTEDPGFWLLRGLKYSLSGLLVALSDFVVLFWTALAFYLVSSYEVISCFCISPLKASRDCAVVYFACATALYIVYVVIVGRSRDSERVRRKVPRLLRRLHSHLFRGKSRF